MNEKQGEHLDQRIRQSLAGLPDGPPPSSSFDAARLWEQLRPELTAQPVVAKKRVGGWWFAAASVVGLLVGLWWLQPFISLPDTRSARRVAILLQTKEQKRVGGSNDLIAKVGSSLGQTAQVDKTAKVPYQKQRSLRINPVTITESTAAAQPNITENAAMITPTETPPTAPESPSLSLAVSTAKPIVSTASKRRFRVVHENELMAEDEAHRVRYANEGRAERFVRLGIGSRTMPVPDQDSPGLILPLNRKSTQ